MAGFGKGSKAPQGRRVPSQQTWLNAVRDQNGKRPPVPATPDNEEGGGLTSQSEWEKRFPNPPGQPTGRGIAPVSKVASTTATESPDELRIRAADDAKAKQQNAVQSGLSAAAGLMPGGSLAAGAMDRLRTPAIKPVGTPTAPVAAPVPAPEWTGPSTAQRLAPGSGARVQVAYDNTIPARPPENASPAVKGAWADAVARKNASIAAGTNKTIVGDDAPFRGSTPAEIAEFTRQGQDAANIDAARGTGQSIQTKYGTISSRAAQPGEIAAPAWNATAVDPKTGASTDIGIRHADPAMPASNPFSKALAAMVGTAGTLGSAPAPTPGAPEPAATATGSVKTPPAQSTPAAVVAPASDATAVPIPHDDMPPKPRPPTNAWAEAAADAGTGIKSILHKWTDVPKFTTPTGPDDYDYLPDAPAPAAGRNGYSPTLSSLAPSSSAQQQGPPAPVGPELGGKPMIGPHESWDDYDARTKNAGTPPAPSTTPAAGSPQASATPPATWGDLTAKSLAANPMSDDDDPYRAARRAMGITGGNGADAPGQSYQSPVMQEDAYA